ncbi:transketolase [Patescibacteria group bacterium]|nr:transketolase [Patescibacteria group bacterium]MBU1702815.1 transketolase [Patescibacteria group bacterium]MBU1953792.1 transketolase [Patescibacteria group bacterium]
MEIPKIGQDLSQEQIKFLETVAKSCRGTIIAMLKQAQSGHPGGSLSCIDYLSLLYSFIISQSGQKIVVSNGHISPAVYSILAEIGYIPKDDVINTFRQLGSIYEGHVTRHVKGVYYGTGPLGIGVSVAAAFALAEKLHGSSEKVFALMGDGEAQEGQVYEMTHFAAKYKLDNLITFIDYNEVQLTASLEEIMPLDLPAIFKSAKWHVIEADGHDFAAMWKAIGQAYEVTGKPVVIIGHTIMGKGVDYMETEGKNLKSTWHGNAPKPDMADLALSKLALTDEEKEELKHIKEIVKWSPADPKFTESLKPMQIDEGEPVLYGTEETTDCRSAYGAALLDLAKRNKSVLALSADLRDSVKTGGVAKNLPEQHIEVGIAEQNMLSVSGGLSLAGYIPFCSTFGAFMTSRAKDQVRVNDINCTNVKMVSTHCGLSVGEDGPTHQALDDTSSFLGFFNTMIIEPADPNQTDRIIRFVASHYGNFYVRMGRHKYPVITKEDGTPFYGTDYKYEYGKSDIIRAGNDLTIVATGAIVAESIKALDQIKQEHSELSIELIAATSIKKFDQTLLDSIKKTGKVITAEDHNAVSGLSSQLAKYLMEENVCPQVFENIAVREYQLSGTSQDLYEHAKISANAIKDLCLKILGNSYGGR